MRFTLSASRYSPVFAFANEFNFPRHKRAHVIGLFWIMQIAHRLISFCRNTKPVLPAIFSASLLLTACGGSDSANVPSSVDDSRYRHHAASTAINPVASDLFYGMNGHNSYGDVYYLAGAARQLAQLQDLGIKLYRNEVYSKSTAMRLANVANALAAGGVTVYPVILMGIDFADEDSAYQSAYALARDVVSVQRYAYYEVTNELGSATVAGWVDGVRPTDFDNQKFQIARGVIRGMIAGIKSMDPSGKIVMGGNAWMQYGFVTMLANGTQPDGSDGHPIVTWDITAWHWYSDQGNIEHACGGTGCYNVIGALARFGKPVWINEMGVRPDFGTDQQAAAFLANDMLGGLRAIAVRYDIESLQIYQLYDDPPGGEGPYGVILDDGQTPKPAYAAVKQFIATNPRP
ncbi:lipopolysaccharide biosynthesis protein [Caballeronia sp. GACF4]|uniref:lipopolysaccharide biosynthesis protein n=1 Tax=Caballeronia sp. GACF4 TaxID=2921763 RepID=UPI002028A4BE|nr:lipopolysaccharide biosynthesis protein [Caballeronia sp. GACF4]